MTRCGNCGKLHIELSTVPTNAWKSQQQRFPHSHRPDPGYSFHKFKVKSQCLYGDGGKVEIQIRDSHFATVAICLRRKEQIFPLASA
jgi:hypothetical protein